MSPARHDLIIVGAGVVGASLARAARGLSVALVAHEKRVSLPRAGFDSRVYALSPGNASFLRDIGAMPEGATPVHAMRIFGDAPSATLEFDAYQAGVPELAWIVEDAALLVALWRGLDATIGRCERLVLEEDGATLFLKDRQPLHGNLVVGADGADSFVRAQAGIAAVEGDYGQEAVVANFRCARPHGHVAFQWFRRGEVLALLPLPGEHVSMVWSRPPRESDDLAREVESASGGVLGGLELLGAPRRYPLRRLRAQHLVAPRVALAGDAGHVIHPLAGQGLNLGLQDARELAAVLAAREPVRDLGDLRLLRRYERARAGPILAMETMVDGLFRLFGAEGALPARLRNFGLNLTDRLPVVKNLLMRQAMT